MTKSILEKLNIGISQVKLIDPSVRGCNRADRLPYEAIMNVSDAVQEIFEYDVKLIIIV